MLVFNRKLYFFKKRRKPEKLSGFLKHIWHVLRNIPSYNDTSVNQLGIEGKEEY